MGVSFREGRGRGMSMGRIGGQAGAASKAETPTWHSEFNQRTVTASPTSPPQRDQHDPQGPLPLYERGTPASLIDVPLRHGAAFLPVRTVDRYRSRNGAAKEGAGGRGGGNHTGEAGDSQREYNRKYPWRRVRLRRVPRIRYPGKASGRWLRAWGTVESEKREKGKGKGERGKGVRGKERGRCGTEYKVGKVGTRIWKHIDWPFCQY